jgi:hypothetical protein
MKLLKRLKAAWLILISKDVEYEHYKRGFEHGMSHAKWEDENIKPKPPEVQND